MLSPNFSCVPIPVLGARENHFTDFLASVIKSIKYLMIHSTRGRGLRYPTVKKKRKSKMSTGSFNTG